MLATLSPFPQYFDTSGSPLQNGELYFGAANQNPQTNPITVYWDAAGTQPAAQPIKVMNGYPYRAGSPAPIYANGDYSLTVRDRTGGIVFYAASSLYFNIGAALTANLASYTDFALGAGMSGYSEALPYVAHTVGAGLNKVITPLNFATVQAAADYANSIGGGTVHVPHGTFTLTSGLTMYARVVFEGRGASTIFEFGDGINAFSATGSAGTRLVGAGLRNLTVRKTAGTIGHHVVATFCDRFVIDNVTFEGGLGANPAYVKLLGCRWSKMNKVDCINGASVIWNSSDETATGTWGKYNTATDCTIVGAPQGFNWLYQYQFRGEQMTCTGSTGAFGCGFVIEGQVDDISLKNCVSEGHVRNDYYIEGFVPFGCVDIRFTGCSGKGSGEAGLNCQANYKDVSWDGVLSGATGTFAAGTGHGAIIAGSQLVRIGGAIHGNAGNGVDVTNGFYVTIEADIHDNTGFPVKLSGTKSRIKIYDSNFYGNTAGNTISGWTYIGLNEWDQGPLESYTPTFYKSNETTVITFSTVVFSFRLVDGFVEYEGYFSGPSAALDSNTYFSIPIAGTWPDNSGGGNALRPRGWASMDVTGVKAIDGAFANDKLRISTTAAADTILRVNGRYEAV